MAISKTLHSYFGARFLIGFRFFGLLSTIVTVNVYMSIGMALCAESSPDDRTKGVNRNALSQWAYFCLSKNIIF